MDTILTVRNRSAGAHFADLLHGRIIFLKGFIPDCGCCRLPQWGLDRARREPGRYRTCEGDVVDDVQIKVAGDDVVGELTALLDWLRAERDLQGFVRRQLGVPGPEDLGGVLDVVTVAVGSGGVAVVLAQSLATWIKNRRPAVKFTITAQDGRTLELETSDSADAYHLIAELLRHVDDADV
jgi:hypothetical protein